ncbi:MAG: hypothetical protein M3Z24_04035, partial [Chloroflexota bacterium]|nr:hypothetical protein [Chloroflexota bacterium]
MSLQVTSAQPQAEKRAKERSHLLRRLHTSNNIATGILWFLTIIVALTFIGIIFLLLLQGLAYLFNPAFYSTSTDPVKQASSIAPELFNTFY